jgi:hypothetical protein
MLPLLSACESNAEWADAQARTLRHAASGCLSEGGDFELAVQCVSGQGAPLYGRSEQGVALGACNPPDIEKEGTCVFLTLQAAYPDSGGKLLRSWRVDTVESRLLRGPRRLM